MKNIYVSFRRARQRVGTIILLFIFLAGVLYSQAQEYIPFPTSDAYWNEYKFYQGNCDPPDYCKVTYFINGDTIINSLLHNKIYSTDADGTAYFGAIREYNKKVYFKRSYCPSEVLLYDFNFDVGDSINYPVELCDTSWANYHIVSSIDSVLLQDMTYRRRINFDGGINDYSWIEGVGTAAGLFYPYYWGITCICNTNLVCFYHNGTLEYLDESTMPCFNLAASAPEFSSANQDYCVHPNPFKTSTTIEFILDGNSKIQISICNSFGQTVYQFEDQFKQGNHKVTWSPAHLPAGMYYAVLRSERGNTYLKIIKQ